MSQSGGVNQSILSMTESESHEAAAKQVPHELLKEPVIKKKNAEPRSLVRQNENTQPRAVTINPHASIEQLLQKEEALFFKSRQFDTQTGAPVRRFKTPQLHSEHMSGKKTVLYTSGDKRLVRGKTNVICLMKPSQMVKADMLFSSDKRCRGEKPNNEIVLKQSLDKYR
ncbi:hypothetical protein PRUB_a4774 [Pseudoalteromonas rubra]|uniref:Uncharacterized protein n=1 Tax=Pseudoalteromonas rubra TaxID=43658 RepID=A0A8T0CBH7_9GAMM|nr:hypothetical protein [Pseudoalteromonas rubra]KAF7787402.1 hypothetical protein PRUB_a4774 [Pseudoalteromonas rubra]